MVLISKELNYKNSNSFNDLIDLMRKFTEPSEIIEFESSFNKKYANLKLSDLICQLLKNRSISRVLAAKWLYVMIENRDKKLSEINI